MTEKPWYSSIRFRCPYHTLAALQSRNPHIPCLPIPSHATTSFPFLPTISRLLQVQLPNPKIAIRLDDTKRVGIPHTALPSLHNDDRLTGGEDLKLDGFGDTPFDALVDVFLPVTATY